MWEMMTSSPASRFFLPQEAAIRLMDSVAPRVKMISFSLVAFRNAANFPRLASKTSVDR